MLLFGLHKLFNYYPKPENSVLERCPEKEGVWDTLGFYDSKYGSVFICERNIVDYAYKLEGQMERTKRSRLRIRFLLRELVRLHEHSHALLHTGDFYPPSTRELIKEGDSLYIGPFQNYSSFPDSINEPLTEFIAWSVIQNLSEWRSSFMKIFNEVEKEDKLGLYTPWRKLRELIDSKCKPRKKYVYYAPGLVKIAREKTYKNLDQFLQEVTNKCEVIKGIAACLDAKNKIP